MRYPDMTAVQDALLAKLQADEVLTGWGVTIDSLPGVRKKEDFASVFSRLPGIGAYCGGGVFTKVDGDHAKDETARLMIVCASQNNRGPAAPHRGGPDEPGAIHLVNAVVAILETWETPDGNLREIDATEWALAWVGRGIAVYILQAEASLTRPKPLTSTEIIAYGEGYP